MLMVDKQAVSVFLFKIPVCDDVVPDGHISGAAILHPVLGDIGKAHLADLMDVLSLDIMAV